MSTTILASRTDWLRGLSFDIPFILGVTGLALLSGAIVLANPHLFGVILFLDLWLLGYHHVISTYTRLCFDRQSFAEHKFLLTWLPVIVLVSVVAIAKAFGVWAIATIYLYWQWFHYTRQSWGVSQAYRHRHEGGIPESENFLKFAFYGVPLFGIAYRVFQQPENFLGFDVWFPILPGWFVAALGIGATGLMLALVISRFRAWRAGRLPLAHSLYLATHFTIFFAGYFLIDDINYGWLVINIWHNAQYVLFVWMFNTKKFQGGQTKASPLLSLLSQPQNWVKYFLFCILLSTTIYLSLDAMGPALALVGLAPLVIVYQVINFHHYIVDSIIWKRKKTA